MTPMMLAILRLLSLMPCMVLTTRPTTSPPCMAIVDAPLASWLACLAASVLLRAVALSCSIVAAVCSSALACSSVRLDRS